MENETETMPDEDVLAIAKIRSAITVWDENDKKISGVGGVLIPFLGIKLIDLAMNALKLV
jgi:high-affinity K+ transport system ATPase subunit B